MKKQFKIGLFGYRKGEVDRYIRDLKEDYENELSKKRDRLLELNEENRKMKSQISQLQKKIDSYRQQEAYISKALVKAEQKAQDIIEDGKKKVANEMYKLELERKRWRERARTIRKELMDFEKMVCRVLEDFRSEINYLASKELSESLLGEVGEENEDVQEESILDAS